MTRLLSTAVMAKRNEPHDSLEDFPTPAWGTRALLEHVLLPKFGSMEEKSVLEPACGRGYMAEVLEEYFDRVHALDVYEELERPEAWVAPGEEAPTPEPSQPQLNLIEKRLYQENEEDSCDPQP